MKKQILFFAVAALALASCSSENDVVQSPDVQQTAADDGAVLFDVYMQRTTTRAGVTGAVTTNDLKSTATDLGKAGFGVFGYYTNNSTYDQQAIPNFFYNQQVYCADGSNFKYEPVKYWPNEYGSTAESDDADKVTYFAYAPYVSVNPSTGKPNETDDPDELSALQKWGINSMTTNSTMGDPLIKYIASFDQAKSVDLTWGVCDETNWQIIQTGASQTLSQGKPWLNVERPANTSQKLKFTFKHATAQLKVNIDAYVDGINNANEIATGTKVYVRSVTFEGLATRGSLNLNNTEAGKDKAYWMDYNGTNDLAMGETVTIYDGRKDGKEGTPSGEATNEKSLGLNPNLIQSTVWSPTTGSAMPGVTNVPQPLFCNGSAPATEPIYVIPTGDPVKITITYDIETADNNLATYVSDAEQHGSSIENVISKSITFSKNGTEIIKAFENGKSYTINLHLGMNSVKFDAFVTDWVPQSAIDVDLPANIPSYPATGAGTPVTATVAADADKYTFAVTGLDPFETITSGDLTSKTPIKDGEYKDDANASGVAILEVALDKNTTVSDIVSAEIPFTAPSGKKVNLTITQKAAPLGLKVSALSTSTGATQDKQFTLSSTANTTNWTGLASDKKEVKVWKNGVPINPSITYKAAGAAICDVLLSEAVEPGDVYTFKVTCGDAPTETATARIAGIVYPTSKKLTYRKDAQDPILPTLYGPGENVVANYDWTEVTSEDIKVSTDGKITTDKATDTETAYTATLKTGYQTDATSKGWFFSSTSLSATLQLTADKQDAVGSFTAPTIAAQTYNNSGGTYVHQNVASAFSFKGKLDKEVDAAEGLTISCELVKVTKDGKIIENPSSLFPSVSASNIIAKVLESGQYVVTVKASLPTNDKFNETSVTGDFKFTAN